MDANGVFAPWLPFLSQADICTVCILRIFRMMLKTRHSREGAVVFLCSVPSISRNVIMNQNQVHVEGKVGHSTLKVYILRWAVLFASLGGAAKLFVHGT